MVSCLKCKCEKHKELDVSLAKFTCGHYYCFSCIKNTITLNQVLKYTAGSTISVDCLFNHQNCNHNGYYILQLGNFLQFLNDNSISNLNYNEDQNIYSSKEKKRTKDIENTLSNLSRTYKEKIFNDINLTSNKIDVLILYLHESKNEYKSRMEKIYENYNSILKIVQHLLLESKNYSDTNLDCIKLINDTINFGPEIENELKEQSESVFNYLYKEIKNIKNETGSSNNLIGIPNSESIFTCDVEKVNSSNVEGVFYGHTNTIWTLIELSQNSIASGSYDNTICIWNMNSHEAIQTLSGHKSKVTKLYKLETETSIAEEITFVSGSADNTIMIWSNKKNKTQFELLDTLYGHSSTVNSIIQFGNDKLISSALEIIVWGITKNFSVISILATYKHPVTVLCNLSLGQGFVCGSYENIYVWNDKLKCIDIIKTSNHYVTCMTYFEDNDYLITGAYDKCIKVWSQGKCFKSLKEHTNTVWGLFIINKVKFCSSSCNEIIIWDLNKFISLVVIEEDNYALIKLSSGKFAYSCYDNKIKVLNTDEFLT